jgi:hypothetical protein
MTGFVSCAQPDAVPVEVRSARNTAGTQGVRKCGLWLYEMEKASVLEKLTVPKPSKKLPILYDTRMLTTVFTTAHHLSQY